MYFEPYKALQLSPSFLLFPFGFETAYLVQRSILEQPS